VPADVIDALRARLRARCASRGLLWVGVGATLVSSDAESVELRCLHVTPTARIVALPGWRDTDEGVIDHGGRRVLWTSHEVGKGLRLLLRQSHFMLELLASGDATALAHSDWPSWSASLAALMPSGLTSQASATCRAMGEALAREGEPALAARHLLTGLLLAQEGTLSSDPAELIEAGHRLGGASSGLARLLAGGPESAEALREGVAALRAVEGFGVLPARPPGYDALSAWLVRLRMAGPGAGVSM